MMNPWKEVDLDDYESHMSLDSVAQLQALNDMTGEQIYDYDAADVMIMGVAGGNGLNHIDKAKIRRVYGVDINGDYLNKCRERFADLGDTLVTIQADLTDEYAELPHADLVIANLLLEYVGYASFARNIRHIAPHYVSVIIQINEGDGFVSDSPYLHSFDKLNEVYNHIDGAGLTEVMSRIGYHAISTLKRALPNGKALERLDFCIKN
ncbi:MAG: class I SAM-dependent methyltransferase, partial [Firmicutes bacterium]|nr:class I SAM-dependent methyltransferase [Bacillota bacterium]